MTEIAATSNDLSRRSILLIFALVVAVVSVILAATFSIKTLLILLGGIVGLILLPFLINRYDILLYILLLISLTHGSLPHSWAYVESIIVTAMVFPATVVFLFDYYWGHSFKQIPFIRYFIYLTALIVLQFLIHFLGSGMEVLTAGLNVMGRHVVTLFAFLGTCLMIQERNKRFPHFLKTYLIFILLESFLIIFQSVFHVGGILDDNVFRPAGTVGHNTVWGFLSLGNTALMTYLLLSGNHTLSPRFLKVVLSVSWLGVILLTSRTGLIACVLLTLFMFLRTLPLRRVIPGIIAIAFTAVLIAIPVWGVGNRFTDASSLETRLGTWDVLLSNLKCEENFCLIGQGPYAAKTFVARAFHFAGLELTPQERNSLPQVDNLLLEYFYDYGWLASLLLLCMLGAMALSSLKAVKLPFQRSFAGYTLGMLALCGSPMILLTLNGVGLRSVPFWIALAILTQALRHDHLVEEG